MRDNFRLSNTGKVLEDSIVPALEKVGYFFQREKVFKNASLKEGKYIIDFYVEITNKRIGIEFKWQQKGGTAEQKIPFTALSLLNLIDKDIIDVGYIVIGGKGWTYRDFYIEKLSTHMNLNNIEILDYETFLAKINSFEL